MNAFQDVSAQEMDQVAGGANALAYLFDGFLKAATELNSRVEAGAQWTAKLYANFNSGIGGGR